MDGLHPITIQILKNRGITTPEAIRLFLDSPIAALHDPFLMPDMGRAVDRIVRAVHAREPITLFGDYDTDGCCAAAMMQRFFEEIGISAAVMLPHRLRDGYGLSVAAMDRVIAAGGGLLITVDNGTTAHEAVACAQSASIDVIVTDHHQCKEKLPAAFACVNPHRTDSIYPYKDLCGTGVAFKLLMALRRSLRNAGFFKEAQPNLQQYLPLVAIATIADVMPLTGENRILVKRGIEILRAAPDAGLATLMRLSAIEPAALNTEAIAFRIAPRLNAAGRMADPEIALRCLANNNATVATEAATELDRLNARRQAVEQTILAALDAPEQQHLLNATAGITIGDVSYPIGIVGIIAGRLARQYRKPAVVVSFEGGIGRGSARSIPNLDIISLLNPCADYLTDFGGHSAAAGITVSTEQWPAFQAAFSAAAAAQLEGYVYPAPHIDATVDATALTPELGRDLKRLAPFGEGNPEPVLAVRPMTVHSRRMVGKNHLKMRIGDAMTTVDAIGFGLWNHPDAQGPLEMVLGVPELNTWNGETRLQLRLLELNPKLQDHDCA